jgi:hypothetical protein
VILKTVGMMYPWLDQSPKMEGYADPIRVSETKFYTSKLHIRRKNERSE